MLLTADYIGFRYAKLSTRWKKLIMFSNDMAVIICNHPHTNTHNTLTGHLNGEKVMHSTVYGLYTPTRSRK